MKIILTILVSVMVISSVSFCQDETKEVKKTVSTTKGDTTISESVIISKTQDITPRSSMVIINPLKFILFYNLSYYHQVSEQVVVGGGFQMPTLSGINGFGINFEARIYPSGKNMRGFYVAPNISFSHLTSGNVSSDPFSLGVLLGWQWFPGDEFAMGLGIGLDYYFGSVSDSNEHFGSYNGTAPALRFDIGYAW